MTKKFVYIVVIAFIATQNIFGQSPTQTLDDGVEQKVIKRSVTELVKGKWTFKAQYPELQMQGGKLNLAFNKVAKDLVMKHIAGFRNAMEKITAKEWKNKGQSLDYEMSLDYKIDFLNDEFISINFVRNEYTGGAHGNTWTFTLNHDLKNNRVIKLSDIFKENSNFLNIISKSSIEQISKKQGRNADVDWINEGASPNEKHFRNWNITEKGLKFSFDPYQVGAYSAGSFETIVPYSQFLTRMRNSLFDRVQTAGYINGSPANWCRNGLFSGQAADFKIAYVTGETGDKIHFRGDDEETCPEGVNCKSKSYLIPRDEVIIGRIYNNYACAWYQANKGSETVGWLPLNKLSIQVRKSRSYNWGGEWSFDGNEIKFSPKKTVGDFLVTGNAVWKGFGDNVHIGDIEEVAVRPKDGMVKFGGSDKYDCKVKMQRIGEYLIVSDNKNCGGMNVTFDGIYTQKKSQKP